MLELGNPFGYGKMRIHVAFNAVGCESINPTNFVGFLQVF